MPHPSRSAWFLAALSLIAAPAPALANDHNDLARAGLRGEDGDITSLYAWTSADGKRLNLGLPWAPQAGPGTRFSDAVQWVFRVASRPEAKARDAAELVILCTFDSAQRVSCWAGEEYLSGDASGSAGLASPSGRLRVFTGLRNDPFFFNLTGFAAAKARINQALVGAPRDAAGCPTFDPQARSEILRQLSTGANGAAARDDLAGQNVLTLVVEVDLSLVTRGGPVLAVSGSTHKRP